MIRSASLRSGLSLDSDGLGSGAGSPPPPAAAAHLVRAREGAGPMAMHKG